MSSENNDSLLISDRNHVNLAHCLGSILALSLLSHRDIGLWVYTLNDQKIFAEARMTRNKNKVLEIFSLTVPQLGIWNEISF